MKLLTDKEILDKVKNSEILAEGFKQQDSLCWTTRSSAIQPCSLDLHIGQIYLPSRPEEFRSSHCLKPGQTVVIRTREILDFSNNIAAIGFPPSTMSGKGILTTNPGHIDPGYRGVFHVTLINMGKEDFALAEGSVIVTLLLFELDNESPVQKGYMQRMNESCEKDRCPCETKDACTAEHAKGDATTNAMLECLAPDFMDFESRAKTLIQRRMLTTGWFRETMKVIPAVLGALAIGFLGYLGIDARIDSVAKEHDDLNQELKMLEGRIDGIEYYDKIRLKDRIGEIEERLNLEESKQRNDMDIEDKGS